MSSSGSHVASPHTADTFACQGCGASFRIAALGPIVVCPHCRHQHAISPQQLEHLEAYRQQVGAHHAAADEHAQHVDAWRRWHGDGKGASAFGTRWFFLLFGACAVVAGAVGAALAALDVIVWAVLPTVVIMGGFLPATVVFYGVYFYRLSRTGNIQAQRAGDVVVACPSCGAPGKLTPGEAIDHCAHCRAPLVPTRAIMDQAIDAVNQARRRAAIERYRTERDAMVRLAGRGAGNALPYVILGPFSIMLTIPSAFFTWEVLLGKTKARPEGVAILWLIVLAMWGAMLALALVRRHRRVQTEVALDHLARQFSGQRLDGIRATARWLHHLWAGPFDVMQFYVGSGYGAAALHLGPYHALLDYNPNGGEHVPRRVQLLIAAWVPRAHDAPGPIELPHAVRPLAAELAREGWEVELQEGGLVLRANTALTRRLRDPTALHAIAPAAGRALRLVSAAGGRPVAEI